MKFRYFILTIMPILLLTPQLYAHGLSMKSGKTIMFDQIENIMVKIELVPDSVNFNQTNQLSVTIIDSDAARLYQGPIRTDLSRLGDNSEPKYLASLKFNKGIFKKELVLDQGGTFNLDLNLGNNFEDGSFKFQFKLVDNKVFGRATILISCLTLLVFLSIITFLLHRRSVLQNKNTTINLNGERLRCDF